MRMQTHLQVAAGIASAALCKPCQPPRVSGPRPGQWRRPWACGAPGHITMNKLQVLMASHLESQV